MKQPLWNGGLRDRPIGALAREGRSWRGIDATELARQYAMHRRIEEKIEAAEAAARRASEGAEGRRWYPRLRMLVNPA